MFAVSAYKSVLCRVCTVSGLCNSARIDALLADRQGGGGDCGLCRAGAAQVAARLAASSPAQVEAGLLELCGHLGSFSTACMETVVEQAEVVLTVTASKTDISLFGKLRTFTSCCQPSWMRRSVIWPDSAPRQQTPTSVTGLGCSLDQSLHSLLL